MTTTIISNTINSHNVNDIDGNKEIKSNTIATSNYFDHNDENDDKIEIITVKHCKKDYSGNGNYRKKIF